MKKKSAYFFLWVTCFLLGEIALGNVKKPKGLAPDKAVAQLKKGNARFLAGDLRRDGLDEKIRAKQKTGEKPHTVVLSCADSRVSPEHIFDQRLGEIYTVRVAGPSLDHGTLASIEHAVENLGVRNVFIMGHTGCDTVKAALQSGENGSGVSEHVDALLGDIRPRVKGARALASEPSPDLAVEAAANAEKLATELSARSKILQNAMTQKKFAIHWGLYHIDTGVVDFH